MFLKIHITNLNGMSWLIYSDTELLTLLLFHNFDMVEIEE